MLVPQKRSGVMNCEVDPCLASSSAVSVPFRQSHPGFRAVRLF